MTKEQLTNEFLRALKDPIKKFTDAPSEASREVESMEKENASKKKELARVFGGTDSAAYKAAAAELDHEVHSSKPDRRSENAQRRRQIAEALMVVANEHRLPLQLKKPVKAGGSGAKGGGRRGRMTREQMNGAVQSVYDALPEKKGEFMAKSELAEKVGFDPQSVLLKMKREGTAQTNGMRGPGGAWRRGKKPS